MRKRVLGAGAAIALLSGLLVAAFGQGAALLPAPKMISSNEKIDTRVYTDLESPGDYFTARVARGTHEGVWISSLTCDVNGATGCQFHSTHFVPTACCEAGLNELLIAGRDDGDIVFVIWTLDYPNAGVTATKELGRLPFDLENGDVRFLWPNLDRADAAILQWESGEVCALDWAHAPVALTTVLRPSEFPHLADYYGSRWSVKTDRGAWYLMTTKQAALPVLALRDADGDGVLERRVEYFPFDEAGSAAIEACGVYDRRNHVLGTFH